MAKYYLIRLGGNLYVATRYYGIFQDTVKGPEKAYRFHTLEEAEKVKKKTFGGKIEEHYDEDDEHNDIEQMKETIKKQQELIDELIEYKQSTISNAVIEKEELRKENDEKR